MHERSEGESANEVRMAWLCAVLLLLSVVGRGAQSKGASFGIHDDTFVKDGQGFQIISGR
jgi:hypothetical protein